MNTIKMRVLTFKPNPKERTIFEAGPELKNKSYITTPKAENQYVCGLCGQVLVEGNKDQFRGLVYKCTNPQCGAYNQIE
jgi:hypothetical protein